MAMNGVTDEKMRKALYLALKICVAVAAGCAFLLTFTVSDYYIFNRIGEYGFFFCISQWFKKAGLIMLLLGAFFACKGCRQIVKYFLPLFVILSCALFGGFFDATPQTVTTDDVIYQSVNLFFPKWLNIALFFLQNALYIACCALLFALDGFKIDVVSLAAIPLAVLAAMPLNLFENFFDIAKVPADSFLRFKNFTIWHLLAIIILITVTVSLYNFLKNKPRERQDKYLAAIAITLLLQYHSKDSMVLGDGYNVYHTIFACLPLFICNIGVYVASISVIVRKKALYAISFFVHAVGALTVFVYFGKDEMSNYGIFCSYSILYFCLTHCLLFALCVLPTALKHYKFAIKDCIIPLIYYFIVIVIASIASTLVSYASTTWTTADGVHLTQPLTPNYAFTQVNPLPFDVPNLIPLGGAFAYINLFYVLLVYVVYVCLFFAFYGLYRAYLPTFAAVKGAIARRAAAKNAGGEVSPLAQAEAAAADGGNVDVPEAEDNATADNTKEEDNADNSGNDDE